MITVPHNYYLQTSPNLYMLASAGNLEAGWGVKFVLDMGTADEKVIPLIPFDIPQVSPGNR